MKKNLIILIGSLLALAYLSGCSKVYKQNVKWSRKGTISQKDSAAFYFYNRGDFEKASFLFEELQSAYRGGARAKTILYHYADSKYKSGFYVVAAYYFEQFTKLYPNDDLTPECTFMIAYCYQLESDPYYLDQNFTRKGIEQFQLFINTYPFSDKVEEANKLMTAMREKLANKEFETASLYYKVENYKAAVTAFEVFIQEYPDSRYREESQFLLFKSAVSLADVSVQSRKKNRYLDAIELYELFVDKFPSSVYIKEAENIYVKAKRNLGKVIASEAK